MGNSIFSALTLVGLTLSTPLFSADQSPPCYRQLQTDFFREDILTTALGLYLVDQSMWLGIYQSLQVATQNVPSLVQAYARQKNPNPLDPYFVPAVAAEILQKALYQSYIGVMQYYAASTFNNTIDQNTVNGIFRYLWEQQYGRLTACMH